MCSALLRIGYLTSQPSGEPPSCSPCPVTGSVSTHVLNAVNARPQGRGLLGTAPVLERMRQELRSLCWEALRPPLAPDTWLLPLSASAICQPCDTGAVVLGLEAAPERGTILLLLPTVPLPGRGGELGGSVWVPERLTRAATWCSEPLQACPAFVKCSSQASQALHHLPP